VARFTAPGRAGADDALVAPTKGTKETVMTHPNVRTVASCLHWACALAWIGMALAFAVA